MADIRTFFATVEGQPPAKRPKLATAGGGGAESTGGPRSFFSWNVNSLEPRCEDRKARAYLQETGHAMPDLVALQETWMAWDTRKRGDLRPLLYGPRLLPPSALPSPGKRDSLGLDSNDEDDGPAGNPPAHNVTGKLDPRSCEVLPVGWAEALPFGYWSCCSYKRRAGVGVLSRIEPLSVAWCFPSMAPEYAAEGRYIELEFTDCYVINVYVPNTGTHRLDARASGWEAPLLSHIRQLDQRKPVIVLGDFNVAHAPMDLT